LPGLCDLVEKDTDSLFVGPATLIHGEFYPQNILASASGLQAIDWECAAFAPGEIDLAMLLDGWEPTDARRIEDAYAEARWPSGAPDYGRRLDAARLYVQMRWLGDRLEWTAHPDIRRRLARLRAAAESLSLL
jgi:thiamine kinase-like enzyme